MNIEADKFGKGCRASEARITQRFEMVPLERLKPNSMNPREHSKKQINALKRGVSELGFNTAITVDVEYNIENIALIMDEDVVFDETLTGFSAAELDPLFNARRTAVLNDLHDDIPAVLPKRSVSRLGDIWEMEGHRLGCGDATDAPFIEVLLGGRKVGLVVCDVPYNLPIAGMVSGLGRHKHADFAMAAGEMNRAEFVYFLKRSVASFLPHLIDGAMVLLFIDWRHLSEMLEAGETSRLELKNILVWVKDNAGMGSLWRSQHEMICAFKHGKRAHRNNIELGVHGRHRSNVLQYPGMNSMTKGRGKALELHSTVKPVALISDLILDVSDRTDLVLDPFGGSGTTIIAAEAVGRKACLCEIEPAFVDVGVRRWQALTSGEARLAATGQTFAEVEAERLGAKEVNND